MPTSGAYGSPTESEFSEHDPSESVKNWDEDKVCEYLRSVKCGEYEKIFRKNHINGENLLEMDKEVLKEMGVEKVGDRVRLFLSIKKLRTRAYANEKKRNRVGYSSNCCLCKTRGLTISCLGLLWWPRYSHYRSWWLAPATKHIPNGAHVSHQQEILKTD
jgi:hypothetical protein